MKIFKVEVFPFYIRAKNVTEVENIMWEKLGVEFTQLRKIEKSDYGLDVVADND